MGKKEYREKLSNKQWEIVRQERESFQNSFKRDLVFYMPLEATWLDLEQEYMVIKRDEDERAARTPFEALCYYVDMGFYPPPEYLRYLVRVLSAHVSSGGELKLDDMLLGPSKQKSGNYGKQRLREEHYSVLAAMVSRRIDKTGDTITTAAEHVAKDLGLDKDEKFDLDTMLRQIRKTIQWKMFNNRSEK